ncbi:MAG: hypothetical protein H0U92_09415 [Actinobacteria bacterium]|nr:hypothetical protein [Actinomycetota bacterium]
MSFSWLGSRTVPAPRRVRRHLAAAGVALAVTSSVLSGCSQGTRQADADAIRHSVPRIAGRPVAGVLTAVFRPLKITGQRPSTGRIGSADLAVAGFVVDAGARRSAMTAEVGGPIVFLSVGRSLYARRTTTSRRERRPWIRVDLERLNETNTPKFRELLERVGPGDTVVASPQLMIDLLAGALTGSITHTAKPAGAVQYKFNVSVDKANRTLRLSQQARDDREKLLQTLAISGDIFKAVTVLRRDGSLQSFKVELHEQPDKQAQFALELGLEVAPQGTPLGTSVTLTPPSRATTIRVGSLGDIRTAVADQMIAAYKVRQAAAA